MFRKTSSVELYSHCFTSCTISLELVTYVDIKYGGNSFTNYIYIMILTKKGQSKSKTWLTNLSLFRSLPITIFVYA